MPRETVSLSIGAEDRATPVLRDVADRADALDRANPDVEVSADDKATGDLRAVADRADQLDRAAPDITVTADTAQAESKLHGLRDVADGLAGGVGQSLAGLGALGPAGAVTAGVGLVAGFLADAAGDSARIALEAQAMAGAFGTSVEEASRLIEAVKGAGIEQADLFDLVNQVSGVLGDQPELARRLGVAARNPLEAFRQVADAVGGIRDPMERANLAQQLFGEEGVRLVAALEARYGSLEAAIAAVDDTLVTTTEDVNNARDAMEKTERAERVWDRLKRGAGDLALKVADVGAAVLEGSGALDHFGFSAKTTTGDVDTLALNLQRAATAQRVAFSPAMATAAGSADKAAGAVAGVTGAVEHLNATPPDIRWNLVKIAADALAATAHLQRVLASGVSIPVFAHVDETSLGVLRQQLDDLTNPRTVDINARIGMVAGATGFSAGAGATLDPNAVNGAQRRYASRNGTP